MAMASCLGIYIENHLIKYAKVSKSNESTKVESFGIKFYENLGETIKKIIEETYSFKTPISVNISEEVYNKLEVFSLLSKKDIEGVIKTEFESICYDQGINKNAYEQRYILTGKSSNGEKIKVIHICTPKTNIEQRKNQFIGYKINSISPVGAIIPNLINNKKETSLIVNIEKNTTITKVTNGTIADIKVLTIGAQDILDKINQKENSYLKSYEICKNSTIYTENDKDLQYEENEYLEDIMPTLFQIVSEVRKTLEESFENIQRVYVTGTASVINNIDIYFQSYLKNVICEILKPSFINNSSKINIKDYIEVNSAISLALQGLEKNNSLNFNKESSLEKISALLKTDVSKGNIKGSTKEISDFIDKYRRQYNTTAFSITLLLVAYIIFSMALNNQLDKKMKLAEKSIQDTNNQISQVKSYNSKFNSEISSYESLIKSIENTNDADSEDKRYKNTIPNLLNNIMAVIPVEVQLTSIENTSDTHIVITARTKKYEQLAYFKTKLKAEEILKNVVSDTGVMQGGYLVVTIEGELP